MYQSGCVDHYQYESMNIFRTWIAELRKEREPFHKYIFEKNHLRRIRYTKTLKRVCFQPSHLKNPYLNLSKMVKKQLQEGTLQ